MFVCVWLFRSIEDLQEQNQKLLAVVRELSSEQEQRETETGDSKCVTQISNICRATEFTRGLKMLACCLRYFSQLYM